MIDAGSRRGRGARQSGGRLPAGQRVVAPNVTISETEGVRYLHFGSVWVQGAMRIARPFALELEYQQQMMAPALLAPRPARIVQFGLGAGALAKFCWRAYPRATIQVVEISDEVIVAAGRWFRLPRDDRLVVLRADAREVLADPRRRAFGGGRADWLQVDLYDAEARGPVCDDEAFYAHCRRLLAPAGVAAINLFGCGFEASRRRIDAGFEGRTLVLPAAEAGNRVVLAFSRTAPDIPHSSLLARAVALEQRLRLPMRRWVGALASTGNRRC